MRIIKNNIERIRSLCARHKVSKLFVFGSILTEKFNKSSDVDFLVDFEGVELLDYADNYFDFKYSLENILNREIDLIEDKAVRNPYLRQNIESSKKLIYG